MYEVYSGGKVPYNDLTALEALKAVSAGRRLERPCSTTSDKAYELMRACMHRDPNQRDPMNRILEKLEAILSDHEVETEL